MSSRRLTTLRKHRRRHTLSQDDVASLLGNTGGSAMCRYEMTERVPCLRTAIALSIVLDASIADLFPDLHEHVVKDITRHARRLLHEIPDTIAPTDPRRQRLEALADLS